MNLSWHIMRKDLFRLRWILLLWIIVLVGQLALGDIQSAIVEEGFSLYYWITFIFGAVFLPVMSFGLVMGVQDDDPVCDTDAFWITRPIAGGRLLAAKAGLLVLLWLLPILITAPWWLWHGYDAGQLSRAAWHTLKVQAVIILLAVPLAVISRNGSRFVLHGMLAVAGFLFLELIYWVSHPGFRVPLAPAVRESLSWVLIALWVMGALTMAFIQYRYRRTRQTIVVMVWVILAGFAACLGWNWDLHPQKPLLVDPEQASSFPLEFQSATLAPEPVGNPGVQPIVTTEFKAPGLRAGEATTVTSVTHDFRWADGSFSKTLTPPVEHALIPACVALILGQRGEPRLQTAFRLPAEVHAQLGHEAVQYSAVVAGQISRLEVVAEVPVTIGGKSLRHGAGVRIDYFVPFLQFHLGLVIPVSETKPVFARVTPAWFAPKPAAADPEFYFLFNRRDGRVLQATVVRDDATLDVATVRYSRATLSFAPGAAVHGSFPDDLRSWLVQATLIKVVAHAAGSFYGTASAAPFKLTENSAATERTP